MNHDHIAAQQAVHMLCLNTPPLPELVFTEKQPQAVGHSSDSSFRKQVCVYAGGPNR